MSLDHSRAPCSLAALAQSFALHYTPIIASSTQSHSRGVPGAHASANCVPRLPGVKRKYDISHRWERLLVCTTSSDSVFYSFSDRYSFTSLSSRAYNTAICSDVKNRYRCLTAFITSSQNSPRCSYHTAQSCRVLYAHPLLFDVRYTADRLAPQQVPIEVTPVIPHVLSDDFEEIYVVSRTHYINRVLHHHE